MGCKGWMWGGLGPKQKDTPKRWEAAPPTRMLGPQAGPGRQAQPRLSPEGHHSPSFRVSRACPPSRRHLS